MRKDNILEKIGLCEDGSKKAASIFGKLYPDFLNEKYIRPSDLVKNYWVKYVNVKGKKEGDKALNGKIFELILSTVCIRENLLPLYLSAKVAFVPNVVYDLMFYTAECGPICLSAKTSLRERYKQADLEAIALKYVHRKAQSYLVTLDKKEAENARKKIKKGDIIGLDDIILADSTEFDMLIKKLKALSPTEPPTVKVIISDHIITRKKISLNLMSGEI